MDPDDDKEIRPVRVLKTEIGLDGSFGSHRFERFSEWDDLIGTIAFSNTFVHTFDTTAKTYARDGTDAQSARL